MRLVDKHFKSDKLGFVDSKVVKIFQNVASAHNAYLQTDKWLSYNKIIISLSISSKQKFEVNLS